MLFGKSEDFKNLNAELPENYIPVPVRRTVYTVGITYIFCSNI